MGPNALKLYATLKILQTKQRQQGDKRHYPLLKKAVKESLQYK